MAAATASEAQQLQENWSNIISQKEDEINKLRERHVSDLEARLQKKEVQVEELQGSLHKLRSDFEYNLDVLEERDKDLREYEEVLAREVRKGQDRSKVIDETRKVIENLQYELQSERQSRSDERNFYKQKLYELKEEAENAKFGKEEAVLRQKEDFERIRRSLEKEVEELNNEKVLQNHQLSNEFTEKIQHLESDLRLQKDESAHKIKHLEEVLKHREEELEKTVKSEQHKAESLSRALETSAEHERITRTVSFEFEEWKIVKEKAIADLESKLQAAARTHQIYVNNSRTTENKLSLEVLELQNVTDQLQETYKRRLSEEYSGLISERDTFKVRAETAEKRLKALEIEMQNAQSAHKLGERDLREKIARLETEKNEALQNLNSTTQDITRKYHAEIRMLKEELWSKNEEISVLRTKESNMKTSLDDRRGDINSYKEQLASSIERERELKRSVRALQLKAELDLEANEAKISESNENVVKQLTQEKDYSSEKVRQYEEKIIQQEDEIESLRKQINMHKQQPLQASVPSENWSPDSSLLGMKLNLSDISPTMSLNTPGKPDLNLQKVNELETENARLKDVIAALRKEMESVQPSTAQDDNKIKALELELQASDADFQEAQNHVRILQSRDATDSKNSNRAELEYLRNQSVKIQQENRSLRRAGIESNLPVLQGRAKEQETASSTVEQISDTYSQERLLVYSKLVDMRNELSSKKRIEQPGKDSNALVSIADSVAELVHRVCKRLEIKAKNLKRVTNERDRILDLNNALRSSIDKKQALDGSSGENTTAPSLLDYNTTDKLLETNEKLSYVQNSLVDLKQQSEELMKYQRETQKLISQTEESGSEAPSTSSRPSSSQSTSKSVGKGVSKSNTSKASTSAQVKTQKPAKQSSTLHKGLQLTGSQAPASNLSSRKSISEGTASQRAKLQAIALRRQKREAELNKPKIRNYNIRDDKEANKNKGEP